MNRHDGTSSLPVEQQPRREGVQETLKEIKERLRQASARMGARSEAIQRLQVDFQNRGTAGRPFSDTVLAVRNEIREGGAEWDKLMTQLEVALSRRTQNLPDISRLVDEMDRRDIDNEARFQRYLAAARRDQLQSGGQ